MEFRVLGPLEVLDDGRPLELGGAKQRTLLAALLLDAGRVVSTDRLIDALWEDDPPETAAKSIQVYVSQLRRVLGRDRIETKAPGYAVRVDDGELDAHRAEQLVARARDAEPADAAAKLAEADALWRGEPFAEFAGRRFARNEIARLEELRLACVEGQIDAELARGRHAEVVGTLEALVAEQPLREGLHAQLMLALYRSGRQAEALAAYQSARQTLTEELGIEPGRSLRELHQAILTQDPSLDAPASPGATTTALVGPDAELEELVAGLDDAFAAPPHEPRRAATALRRRTTPIRAVAAGLAVVAAVAVVVILLAGDRDDETGVALEGAGAHVLDPATGAVQAAVPLGTAPAQIAIGEGAVWTLDADDRTISRIDPRDRANVRTFSAASTPTDVAVGAGALWVGNAAPNSRFGSYPTNVSRLDPESGVVDATVRLPGGRSGSYFQGGGQSPTRIAAFSDAVWAINPDRTVSRIDPRTDRRIARIDDVRAESIAAGTEGVWVVAGPGVARIDPRTNRVVQRVEIAAESLTAVAVGAGSVWVADPAGGSVWRVNPVPEPVLRQIPLEVGVRGVAFGAGRVWVTNEVAGTVQAIDPRTNRARIVTRLPAPQGVAVGAGGVWLTALGAPSADETLPDATCRDVFFRGGGTPGLLVVSDLPLQGEGRGFVTPIVEGIRFVFESRGFRAGGHTVGYASCDDSTAQANGTDVSRCFANAKVYARTPDVIGVIGAYHSFCSEPQIPIANQAPDGPLAMISPSNTFTALTRPYVGMEPGELERLYPTGERNFVRIAAADHLQAVALVQTAKELRRPRVFMLRDREDSDLVAFTNDMRAAAEKLGVDVVGLAEWDPGARDFARLARRVAAARPEAVLMAGAAPPATPALLQDLRAALGRRTALIASDGFAAFDLLRESGRAAQGMYVANYGVANSELPPAGRRLLAAAKRPKDDPDVAFAYGAQAAEILLDAIARSDGTRPSVTRALRATRVEDGILGDIRFDRYGDPVEAPVTIYRMTRDGPVVDRVVQVSSASTR